MTPLERQADLIRRYELIPDPQERLAALIARRPTLPTVPPEERSEGKLVPGCQSRVWMDGAMLDGKCHFRLEAESAMVRGLLGTLCEIYQGGTPEEIAALEPELFETLGIARNLTPTRLNGLAAIRAWLREFALQHRAQ